MIIDMMFYILELLNLIKMVSIYTTFHVTFYFILHK